MDDKDVAYYFFRKLVYVLYLEVGAFQPVIHPEMASKIRYKTAYFQREKERQAADLYKIIENEMDLEKIIEPFAERTGLSLDDVERLFREGDWRNKFGGYTFGGPRWALIADAAIRLKKLIHQQDWESTSELVYEIKKMKTNQGLLINHFERGDRRRNQAGRPQ